MQNETKVQTEQSLSNPTLDAAFRPIDSTEGALTVPQESALTNLSGANAPLVVQLPETQYESEEDLTKEELARVEQQVRQVRQLDTTTVASFGMETQKKFNRQLDALLDGIKTNQAGEAGELVVALRHQFDSMKLGDVKRELEGKGAASIPVIGRFFSAVRRFLAMRQDILKHLKAIEDKANMQLGKLQANSRKLDQLVEVTLVNQRDLKVTQIAGQRLLKMARQEHERMRLEAVRTGDITKLTQLHDFGERVTAFETRLLRMRVALGDSENAVPETRMVQQAGNIASNNIIDTILYDMPGIKSAILRFSSLNDIRKSLRDAEAGRQLGRDIRELNANTLGTVYAAAKATQGDGLRDVESLARATDKMLETMNAALTQDEDNRRKREEAHQKLSQVRVKLVEGLKQHADRVGDTSLLPGSNS